MSKNRTHIKNDILTTDSIECPYVYSKLAAWKLYVPNTELKLIYWMVASVNAIRWMVLMKFKAYNQFIFFFRDSIAFESQKSLSILNLNGIDEEHHFNQIHKQFF